MSFGWKSVVKKRRKIKTAVPTDPICIENVKNSQKKKILKLQKEKLLRSAGVAITNQQLTALF